MFEIDKQKFGSFVSELRKEKGLTQKEVAERLFISPKAISKWETGVNIPDISLLIPLAEILEVSVTELLMCKRMDADEVMDSDKVEGIVKTAIAYSEENPERAYQQNGKWGIIYGISVLASAIGLLLNYLYGQISTPVLASVFLGVLFGAYFCFFVKTKLPGYYDENRIRGIHDGVIRMNIPGVRFTNTNWSYMIKVGRIWACLSMALFPMLAVGLTILVPELWSKIEQWAFLVMMLGGLMVPLCIVGKKYE